MPLKAFESVRVLTEPTVMGLAGMMLGMTSMVALALSDPKWLQNVWLLLAVLGMMTLELLTRWRYQKKFQFPLELGHDILGKLTLIALVLAAALIDGVLIWLSPIGFLSTEILASNWVTRGTLLWLFTGEVYLLILNVGKLEGETAIPPVFRYVIRQIRKQDEKRWPMQGHPMDRWYDSLSDLTDDEILSLIDRRAERKKEELGSATRTRKEDA